MEGRYPNGLLVTRTNCKDPSQEVEFNRWYNHKHLPDVTRVGVFSNAIRFANVDPKSPHGQYLATYETDMEDVSQARPAARAGLDKLGDDRGTPLIESVSTCAFKRLGGEHVAAVRPTRGMMFVVTNCKDGYDEGEFNQWYHDFHLPDMLDMGAFHAAYRYESLDPEVSNGKFLAIYETDLADPTAAAESIGKVLPELHRRDRMFDGLDVSFVIKARRVWPRI